MQYPFFFRIYRIYLITRYRKKGNIYRVTRDYLTLSTISYPTYIKINIRFFNINKFSTIINLAHKLENVFNPKIDLFQALTLAYSSCDKKLSLEKILEKLSTFVRIFYSLYNIYLKKKFQYHILSSKTKLLLS